MCPLFLNVVKEMETVTEISHLFMEFRFEKKFMDRADEKDGLNRCICKYVNKYSWQMYM